MFCGQGNLFSSSVSIQNIQREYRQRNLHIVNTVYIMYVDCVNSVYMYISLVNKCSDSDSLHVSGSPTRFCELMGKADIWLIRTYWDIEYPRPFLPNFKFVGGLHCKPAKPLSEVRLLLLNVILQAVLIADVPKWHPNYV